MKLYAMAGSCSLGIDIALREAGIPFEYIEVDYETRLATDGTSLASINSKGYVPALILDDGSILSENIVILEYIADLKPGAGLAPERGTIDRFRVSEWLAFISTEVHKPYSAIFYPWENEDIKKYAHQVLDKRFAWISAQLGTNSYLHGDQFTIADAFLFAILGWSSFSGYSVDRPEWANFGEYQKRIAARPHVHAAREAEGLI